MFNSSDLYTAVILHCQVVSVLPKKRQVLDEKLLALKNLENSLDRLEVHIPAAKQTLQAVQAKYESGEKQQKISDEDNKVRSLWISVVYFLYTIPFISLFGQQSSSMPFSDDSLFFCTTDSPARVSGFSQNFSS